MPFLLTENTPIAIAGYLIGVPFVMVYILFLVLVLKANSSTGRNIALVVMAIVGYLLYSIFFT